MTEIDGYLIESQNLMKYFVINKGILSSLLGEKEIYVHAVDGVSFAIKRGESFGLVGESGCGKTTIGRLLLLLENPTSGKILFDGSETDNLDGKELKAFRKRTQIIFQDPYSSLDPRKTVYDIIAEPMNIHGFPTSEIKKRITEMMEIVELVPVETFLYNYPHELSGGQRQRVAVARALILNPEFIVADEPVSMIDVSMRIGILNLLKDLRERFNISFLFITHDLAVARYVCDRMAVMYLGKIVEIGRTEEIVKTPIHPYSAALISSVPRLYSDNPELQIKGEVPSAIEPPSGCRFHPRCPYAKEICGREEPQLVEMEDSRMVACHLKASASRM